MRLYCATTNPGKLREFRLACGPDFEIVPVDPGAAVEETGTTFEANARIKAEAYSRRVDGWLFAEDSGLEVVALDGAPGVYSARFAGPAASDEQNNDLLLERLAGATDRRARYVAVIALARGGEVAAVFRGEVEGQILAERRGHGGFGYDPLFWYPPFGATFAEVAAERKFEVSHRRRALDAMALYCRTWQHREPST